MRTLKIGSAITEHGIVFDRLTNGDGRFSINIMVDGQRIHRVLGRESDGTTRTQAEQFVDQLRTDAKHHRLSLPKGRKREKSFSEAAEKYMKRLEAGDGKDMKQKRHRLDLHLKPFFSTTPLSKITTYDVERYKKQRLGEKAIVRKMPNGSIIYKDQPPANGTINRELAVLSHLLNKSIEWGWTRYKSVVIRRLKESTGRITYLTVDQAKQLVAFAMEDGCPDIYPFIVIAIETSMRKTEILSIRKSNIELNRRVIYIPRAKSGPREQPITQHLADFLKKYIEASQPGTDWLFPSPAAKEGRRVDIRKPFRRVVKAAGLDPDQVVRHTLRHTAITHLVQAGVDLPTVKRISGHKTLSMVERYAHANGEHIQAAMDRLDNRLHGLTEKKNQ